ncbi:Bax inhibitor-1/YccA family protein [candidate division FCPU426 bacterium]|nr:Bax inhibitor-1/YccA family protein [candidate division FCPU426 bacterium]
MRTANPALNEKVFTGTVPVRDPAAAMTVQGTVNKVFVLTVLLLVSAFWPWSMFFQGQTALVMPLIWGGLLGGLITALVTIFKKEWAGFTAPLYALMEGLVLGGLSAIFEKQFPGIVIQAVGLTIGTLVMLLFLYTSGLVKATENFKMGVIAATGAICLVYLASMVMGFFGLNMPMIHDTGWLGIGFSLFVVVIAALNLVLDFDFIEQGAIHGAPKYMEWYAAFGLMVTLIWLYIEILRLLAKLRSRR